MGLGGPGGTDRFGIAWAAVEGAALAPNVEGEILSRDAIAAYLLLAGRSKPEPTWFPGMSGSLRCQQHANGISRDP